MKIKSILFIGFLLLFGFISIGVFAQSSTSDQRLVGTWVWGSEEDDSFSLTFNANGTVINSDGESVRWFTTDNKIITMEDEDVQTFEYRLSPDGKTLFIDNGYGESIMFIKRN